MKIRRATAEDRGRIREILVATGRFSQAEVGWAMDLVDASLRGETVTYDAWVAVADASAAGYVLFGPVPNSIDVFDLYWIAVDPTRQGQGIGGTLLRFAEAEVMRRGGRTLLIETRARAGWEPTHEFYRAAGYEEATRIKDFNRIEDDKIVFSKRLTQP